MMGLFGKSFEENVMDAVDSAAARVPGLRDLDAKVDGKIVTLGGVVEKGDTLGHIAQKYLGRASLYTKVFEANRDILEDPNRIFPGQKLRIPE